jgi:hypothetical protein
MFKNFFKKQFIDLYRIKVITLNSEINQYYPQYKDSKIAQFETLMLINNKYIATSNNNDEHYCESIEEANDIINLHKEFNKIERNKLVKNTEIIEV